MTTHDPNCQCGPCRVRKDRARTSVPSRQVTYGACPYANCRAEIVPGKSTLNHVVGCRHANWSAADVREYHHGAHRSPREDLDCCQSYIDGGEHSAECLGLKSPLEVERTQDQRRLGLNPVWQEGAAVEWGRVMPGLMHDPLAALNALDRIGDLIDEEIAYQRTRGSISGEGAARGLETLKQRIEREGRRV